MQLDSYGSGHLFLEMIPNGEDKCQPLVNGTCLMVVCSYPPLLPINAVSKLHVNAALPAMAKQVCV